MAYDDVFLDGDREGQSHMLWQTRLILSPSCPSSSPPTRPYKTQNQLSNLQKVGAKVGKVCVWGRWEVHMELQHVSSVPQNTHAHAQAVA